MVLAQASSQGPSFSDLIWIIILLTAFQPAVQRYVLNMRRLRLLRRIERQRDTRVIALIHRQETMGLLGFPILRYLDIQDSEEVLRAIRLTPPEMPIDVILHTPGGLVLAADQIAEALCHHPGRVSAIVPHYAMSGGTLVAMAADEILMAPSAVLGPVDPQLGQYPAASILAAVGQKPVAEVNDRTLILADIAGKAMRQIGEAVQHILRANGMAADQAKVIA
jgi:ClpP class serine protease